MAPQQISAPQEVLDDFPTQPTQADVQSFRLPNHRSLTPPVDKEDLHDVKSSDFDRELSGGRDSQFIGEVYARVRHPDLDGGPNNGLDDDVRDSLGTCHNGLRDARRQEYLEDTALHQLGLRLVAWTMRDPNVPLGGYADGNWWIAPNLYIIKTGPDRESSISLPGPEDSHSGWGAKSEHRDQFLKARFTVHWVHCTEPLHYAVIIRQARTGNALYFDSLVEGRAARADLARTEFEQWLANSGISSPLHWSVVPITCQSEAWSCSIHAMANAMAFLRLGVMGWDKIDHFRRGPNRAGDANKMRDKLIKCLHRLMGLSVKEYQGVGKPLKKYNLETDDSDREMEEEQLRREMEEERLRKEHLAREAKKQGQFIQENMEFLYGNYGRRARELLHTIGTGQEDQDILAWTGQVISFINHQKRVRSFRERASPAQQPGAPAQQGQAATPQPPASGQQAADQAPPAQPAQPLAPQPPAPGQPTADQPAPSQRQRPNPITSDAGLKKMIWFIAMCTNSLSGDLKVHAENLLRTFDRNPWHHDLPDQMQNVHERIQGRLSRLSPPRDSEPAARAQPAEPGHDARAGRASSVGSVQSNGGRIGELVSLADRLSEPLPLEIEALRGSFLGNLPEPGLSERTEDIQRRVDEYLAQSASAAPVAPVAPAIPEAPTQPQQPPDTSTASPIFTDQAAMAFIFSFEGRLSKELLRQARAARTKFNKNPAQKGVSTFIHNLEKKVREYVAGLDAEPVVPVAPVTPAGPAEPAAPPAASAQQAVDAPAGPRGGKRKAPSELELERAAKVHKKAAEAEEAQGRKGGRITRSRAAAYRSPAPTPPIAEPLPQSGVDPRPPNPLATGPPAVTEPSARSQMSGKGAARAKVSEPKTTGRKTKGGRVRKGKNLSQSSDDSGIPYASVPGAAATVPPPAPRGYNRPLPEFQHLTTEGRSLDQSSDGDSDVPYEVSTPAVRRVQENTLSAPRTLPEEPEGGEEDEEEVEEYTREFPEDVVYDEEYSNLPKELADFFKKKARETYTKNTQEMVRAKYTMTEQVVGTSVTTQATQPTGTQPSGTQPSDSQPSGTQPTGTQPSGTEPSESQPSGTQPSDSQAQPPRSPTPEPLASQAPPPSAQDQSLASLVSSPTSKDEHPPSSQPEASPPRGRRKPLLRVRFRGASSNSIHSTLSTPEQQRGASNRLFSPSPPPFQSPFVHPSQAKPPYQAPRVQGSRAAEADRASPPFSHEPHIDSPGPLVDPSQPPPTSVSKTGKLYPWQKKKLNTGPRPIRHIGRDAGDIGILGGRIDKLNIFGSPPKKSSRPTTAAADPNLTAPTTTGAEPVESGERGGDGGDGSDTDQVAMDNQVQQEFEQAQRIKRTAAQMEEDELEDYVDGSDEDGEEGRHRAKRQRR
ncbi:hypothetical protein QBC46DRAFT_339408 [Diplogelasinospora grovesii]|uniref:Ubiquitin-like protease family profile domain-containing protein n=1 Tax=Diplogelasinospora grovesii TaxID=303347 RepID=A0AAN6NB17_9PEZI|nr:hypothetical protein QBC46DRAFT_339408 [Diplogelasinospora grovesii]